LVRKAQLPAPQVNAVVAGFEVDFVWTKQQLVVEVDGFAFHSSRTSFEGDRRRDARLTAVGFRVMRTTWRQIVHEPEVLLVHLSRALPSPVHRDELIARQP
jgi:very-short-patch-repair endonuclease